MATTYQYSASGTGIGYSVEFNITPNSGPLGSGSKLTIEGKTTYHKSKQGADLYLEFRPTGSQSTVQIGSVFKFRTWSSGDSSTSKTSTFTSTITLSQTIINRIFVLLSGDPTSAEIRVRFSAESDPTGYISDLSYTLYKQRVNPSLSNPALTDRHPAISGTDTPYTFFGGFVQGESLPRFETDFTLDSHFPALTARHTLTITQNDVEVLTLTQDTAAGVTHVAFDLDAFTATGQFTLGYTLRDGAANTATLIAQFTVYAYSPPGVTSFLLERYRTIPGGTELADDGEHAWLTLAGSVASVNSLNACSVTLAYSHDGGAETTVPVTSGTDGLTLAYTRDATVLAAHTFDAQYTYDFVLTVADMLHTVTMTGSIYKAGGFFCVEKNGVAVGMRAKNDPNDKRFDVHPDYTSHFGGAVYAEGAIHADGGIDGVTIYSSGEVETGGKWIDGSPIYRYIVTGSLTASQNNTTVSIGTLPLQAGEYVGAVVSIRGMIYASSNANFNWIPASLAYSGDVQFQTALAVRTSDHAIRLRLGSNTNLAVAKKYYAIVEYTKASTEGGGM